MPKTLDKDLALRKAKSAAVARGGECLSTEYTRATDKMAWRCAEGHPFEATYTSVVHQHNWCFACAALFRGENTKQYNLVKKAEKAVKASVKKAKVKSRVKKAPKTSYQIIAKELQRLPEDTSGIVGLNDEEQHELSKEENGYLRAYMPTRWCCPKGHTWNATFNAVRMHGFGCPKCRMTNNNGDKT